MPWTCYIIANGRATYVGASSDPHRRLRQHNGEISGGARYTTSRKGDGWTHECIIRGFQTKIQALQFEWAVKHAAPRRRYGMPGRITKLAAVIRRRRWTRRAPLAESVHLTIEWCTGPIPAEIQQDLPVYVTPFDTTLSNSTPSHRALPTTPDEIL